MKHNPCTKHLSSGTPLVRKAELPIDPKITRVSEAPASRLVSSACLPAAVHLVSYPCAILTSGLPSPAAFFLALLSFLNRCRFSSGVSPRIT